KLDQMANFCETRTCRRKFLLNYFGEKTVNHCGSCDTCLSEYKKFDATIPVQKLLSAISRLGEKFGTNYIIDFLRGSKSVKDDHFTLKTYGVGTEWDKDEWKRNIRQLIDMGLVTQTTGEYPVLKLNAGSWSVLRGFTKVELFEPAGKKATVVEKSFSSEDKFFGLFKAARQKMAEKENTVPHNIFSDATLLDLARNQPDSLEKMSLISGFSEVKLKKYGPEFLSLIKENTKGKTKEHTTPKHERTSDTKSITLKMFNEGQSVEDISEQRQLLRSTIEGHLAHYVRKGQLDPHVLLSKEKIAYIFEAVKEIGGNSAMPIKEKLGDDYSFAEIRIVLNYWQWMQENNIEV
ncbi:MAG TPA: RQC domain-containing protein, partial [Flavitalea sp.]|nr:RQC domain-containing protein [Flavitalea sp.]